MRAHCQESVSGKAADSHVPVPWDGPGKMAIRKMAGVKPVAPSGKMFKFECSKPVFKKDWFLQNFSVSENVKPLEAVQKSIFLAYDHLDISIDMYHLVI